MHISKTNTKQIKISWIQKITHEKTVIKKYAFFQILLFAISLLEKEQFKVQGNVFSDIVSY